MKVQLCAQLRVQLPGQSMKLSLSPAMLGQLSRSSLPTQRAMLISFLCHPGARWEVLDALSFVSFRDATREKKSNFGASFKGFYLFPQLRDWKLSSDIALLRRVSTEERRIGTSFNCISEY